MGSFQFLKQSLAARLSLGIIVCMVVLFMTALGVLFYYSRQAVKEEAIEKATQTLEGTLLHVENTLHEVEVAADNMKWQVEQHIDTPDSMFTFSKTILEQNPNLNGCSIAFDPYFYPEKGKYFSAYSHNADGLIETEQEGSDLYEYYCMDWYLIPYLLERPYWVEPFREYDTGGISVSNIITSYCQPLHDKSGKTVGVLSVDLSLEWFSRTITEAKPFPNSYSILLGRGGTFLVHPDSTKLFYQTIFTPTMEVPDTLLSSLGEAMVNGESGYKVLQRDGKDLYIFYKPFKRTEWSVAIVCSEEDIFEPYNSLQRSLMCIAVLGLILLFIFCILIIRRGLRPLKELAISAQSIADGEYEKRVPVSRRRDEIGHLQHSFSLMQKSLSHHMNELNSTTEKLTQRNQELQKAYELAKEADRVKTAFINNMTDQMAHPVSIIAAESDILREGHTKFSPEEMTAHVDKMLENTEAVTKLLNLLLDASEHGSPSVSPDTTTASSSEETSTQLSNEETPAS